MEKIGDSGKYQKCMLLVFSLSWFVTGIILLSTAFLFRSPSFDCKAHGLLISEKYCQQYVCNLHESVWQSYLSDDNHFRSLATTGNYLCENSLAINLVSSCTYLGAFLGYILISFFADNYGRKKSILISWSICVAGTIIVATSFHL
jgi:OCT family organic cation transporter-like MFS transporter 4/5